ncbi:N-acetylmuramoyl-L-alanine amidase [Streptomyces sp. TRM66268-LWL]|uniref:N-acetylmuramoyl-L-alanine amidase n=1 Tax=Streptomyces polyasparticus TaxID=2767826 RepID=A0ABR7SAN7_9ACTN|nr:N-acetylmuramoyl-L-alanine amidase [Streptomyces polyasparticus]MBC9712503.1 N-acetylmuramoyl-L-alanine amidase [Streptomyces polyasparticus]
MSYSYDDPDDPGPKPRRPLRRGAGLVAVAALVPTALAGWLLWQAMGGAGEEDEPPKVLPLPSGSSSTAQADPSRTQSPSGKPSAKTPDDPKPSQSTGKPAGGGKGPLAGKVVVIDPGHNPSNFRHPRDIARLVDIGTNKKECDTTGTSTNSGYTEAEFTLDVSRRIRELLEDQGATVKLTQDRNRAFGPCVDERAEIGNEAEADAVVSVHADGSAAGNRGFHVILPAAVQAGSADTRAIVGPSRDLGVRIAGRFVSATGMAPSNYVGEGTGLDVRRDLGGLNLTKVPKVFVECGNMRDAKDAALLGSASWRQKAAKGIADGVSGFLKS